MLIEFDETAATASDAVDRLQELDRLLSKLHAIQADLLVTAADTEAQELEVWVRDDMTDAERRLLIEDPIRDELAAALHRSSLVMQQMIETARWLAGPLRPTWQALHEGRITMSHVRILEEAARELPEELLLEFQAKVLPRACDRTLANTRRAVRETVQRMDHDGCVRRRKTAICTRDVSVMHEPDGVSVIWARLRTEQAVLVMKYVDAVARARAEDAEAGSALLMGEHRADALAVLVAGGGSPTLRARLEEKETATSTSPFRSTPFSGCRTARGTQAQSTSGASAPSPPTCCGTCSPTPNASSPCGASSPTP